MKTRYIIPAVILLAACQHIDDTPLTPKENNSPESGNSAWTLTVQAQKGGAGTKALNLINEGNTLEPYWTSTEKVKVYKDNVYLFDLDVTPDEGEHPLTATLSSNSESLSGLSQGDALTLLIPRDTWDYTGQTGVLTGAGSVENTYDYAVASVSVNSVKNNKITTSDATFLNQQSVYRFTFTGLGDAVTVADITLSDTQGGIIRSRTLSAAGGWTSEPGSLFVQPGTPTLDPFFLSIRNENTGDDTYTFTIHGSNSAYYQATKAIPASVLAGNGKYIKGTVTASQPDFSPASGETTETAL